MSALVYKKSRPISQSVNYLTCALLKISLIIESSNRLSLKELGFVLMLTSFLLSLIKHKTTVGRFNYQRGLFLSKSHFENSTHLYSAGFRLLSVVNEDVFTRHFLIITNCITSLDFRYS